VLIGASVLLSALLGVGRIKVYTYLFGGGDLATLMAAMRVTDMFFFLLIGSGAISLAVIPEITGKGAQERRTLISGVLVLSTLMLGVLLAGGYFLVSEMWAASSVLYIHLAMQPIALCWSSILSAYSERENDFRGVQVAPVVYGVLTLLLPLLAPSLLWVVWTINLAALMHLVVNWRVARKNGFRFTIPTVQELAKLGGVLRNGLPRVLTAAVEEGARTTIFAIALNWGSPMTAVLLQFSFQIAQMPGRVVNIAIGKTSYPKLCGFALEGDRKALGALIRKDGVLALGLLSVAVFGWAVLGQWFLLLVTSGEVQSSHTLLWQGTLVMLLGVLPRTLILVINRLFYAVKRGWWPLINTVAGLPFVVGAAALWPELVAIALGYVVFTLVTGIATILSLKYLVATWKVAPPAVKVEE